jgi:peptide subunit release factor 1 (eRF1)
MAPQAAIEEARGQALNGDKQPSFGWAVAVGSVLALAVTREIVRRAAAPSAAVVRRVSRSDAAFGLAVLLRFLARVGASSAGPRPG